jgi:hypothetical protein
MILWFLKWQLRREYRKYQDDLQRWKAGRVNWHFATRRAPQIAKLSHAIERRERLQTEV